MYTKAFEHWWTGYRASGAIDAAWLGLHEATIKRAAWESWRVGREQMSEELSHLRLQPIRAA